MRRAILSTALFIVLLILSFSDNPSRYAMSEATPSPFKVGVVLNKNSTLAKMGRLSLEIAVSDFYLAHRNYKTKLSLHFRFPERGPVPAASAASDLIVDERVHAIIGPQTSDEADFIALIGSKMKVPIVSFSATSPSVSPKKTPFFVRTAVDDSYQANATAALISYFSWNSIVPVYEQSEYGTGMIPYIADAVKSVGASIPYSVSIPSFASDDFISKELLRLMTMECRVFLVHMTKALALRFFSRVNEEGMMSEGFAWILSEGLTSRLGAVDPLILKKDFHGIVGFKPYVRRSEKLEDFRRRWLREWGSRKESPEADTLDLTVDGLWAYDTIWAIAMAAERVGPEDPGYSEPPQSLTDLKNFSSIGFSKTGERLLDAILLTKFRGISGNFSLADGQLDCPAFEIVNVVDKSERRIGYWTEHGLRRQLDDVESREISPVIWPGDTTAVPRGWVYPLVGKKLRILVPGPVDPGFHSFLRADRDNSTGKLIVGGFVIEVFESAVKRLPYPVLVEYYQISSTPKPTYDDLVRLISNKEYDGLVGDVTITAKRANYADFTLPYTTTGVSMIVPVEDDRRVSAWFFRRPFSPTLWIVSGAFFIITGLVVWLLEHPTNKDFRGPFVRQIGTASYFIFSTIVFSQKEKMMNNLSKIVLIIWMYVVLVLQSSYTASLTSMLTVKHLRPTAKDFHELIYRGENVGYLQSSFTRQLLLDQNFTVDKLKPFRSPQEYLEALSKGTKNGGVGAIIDEIPYLKLFLKDYCQNYTMAGNPYKAGGFAFVFPKGSPLVRDISRSILYMGEGDEMIEIERRWFGSFSSCVTEENALTSERLTVSNFWGLFLITGVASGLMLIAFLVRFLYRQWQVLRSATTLRNKVKYLIEEFLKKDNESHTISKKKESERYKMENSLGSPSPCNSGRSSGESSRSRFMEGVGSEMLSALTSGCPSPLIMGQSTAQGQEEDIISPLERGALSPQNLVGTIGR